MNPNVFMSYSRQEVGFVDELAHRLENEGFKVWLDYRSLVPGTPWAEQIHRGVDDSEVILLVVSKASIASKYVEFEWQRVIEKEEKRIILLIFEAVDLPKVLEKYEWVDFRGKYEEGFAELVRQLRAPEQEEHPVPEVGFKVPSIVWRAFWLSVITVLLSIPTWWSFFVPYFLWPLPYRIIKRDFNITQVQAALWLLPIVLLLTSFASSGTEPDWTPFILLIISLLVVPILVLVLRSRGMRRWGKPQASLSKFTNLYHPEDLPPKPVTFFVDHAPHDRRIADEMAAVFQHHGHPRAMDLQSAQAVFVLLSKYKDNTEANPESQTVFPVMIQTCTPAEKLSKVQWIDFRRGVRNLESMAKLLPEPARLLAALGVRPTGNQLTLPPIIMSMYYYVILLGIFVLGSNILLGMKDRAQFFAKLPHTATTLLLMGGTIFFMIRALTQRHGLFAAFTRYSLALLGLGVLIFWQSIAGEERSDQLFNLSESYPLFAYMIGMIVMALFLAIRFRDVRRWFPAKAPKS